MQSRRFFMAAAQAVGGYGPFEPLDAKTKDIFAKALAGLTGVGYTPLIVATQVVAGTNYLYMCNGHVVAPQRAILSGGSDYFPTLERAASHIKFQTRSVSSESGPRSKEALASAARIG
jgi:hypothetical protein